MLATCSGTEGICKVGQERVHKSFLWLTADDSVISKISGQRRRTHVDLDSYWNEHSLRDADRFSNPSSGSPPDSPSSLKFKSAPNTGRACSGSYSRFRSVSDATALGLPGHDLSPVHPALSLLDLVNTFGPLLFPLHRAALLRKRILIISSAPIERACNFGEP